MDPFELLMKDHKVVKELFEKAEEENDRSELIKIAKQITRELAIHTAIEEQYFYPALENAEPTKMMVLEAYEEHRVVTEGLGDVEDNEKEVEVDVLKSKIKTVADMVLHHVEEEENELFEQARKILSEEEQMELGTKMSNEKKEQSASTKA